MTRFSPDPTKLAEFLACLWHGPVPEDLLLHKWLYRRDEPRSMYLLWEGGAAAEAYIDGAFGGFGTLDSETVTDATAGLSACFDRDLAGFGDFLRHSRGANEEEVAAQLDLRRRGLEAATLDAAAAAGRAWQAERA